MSCSAALRGVAHKIGARAKAEYISPSSPVFCSAKYRGGVRKDGGVEKTSKSMSKIPAFIGRRLRRQTQKPDNRGGASWFVLLAAEKNEQIKRINVTRTFFDWERKSFVSQSSLAVPRSITGCHKTAWRKRLLFNPLPLCFVTQNIGGVPKGRRG